jgi:predicted DNA-binding transcriptional regulator YafY
MATRGHYKNGRGLPREQIFRYWVELRDLQSGSTRNLPLDAIARIRIPKKRNETPTAREEFLQLKDGPETIEAGSLDELAVRLQQKYPDELYERTLHRERDHEAEERRAHAMDQLIDILAQAVAEELLRDAQVK